MATAITIVENKQQQQQQVEDATFSIPVLTVLKNNAILKNIFILSNSNNINNDGQDQTTVLVGRHPKCDIVLTHPSVSRFHLRVLSHPSSRSLSLLDLSSVHGTWVNGRKLEAGVSVHMKQGDTFTVGVSTRAYRLSWVPFTRAFNSENPFLLELDANLSQKQEQEQLEIVEDVSFCTEELQSADSVPECDNSLSADENLEQNVGKEIVLPEEDTACFCCDEERKSQPKDETSEVLNDPFGTETSHFRTNFDSENNLCERRNQVLSPPYVQSVDEVDNSNTEQIEACPEGDMLGETNLLCTLREYLTESICLPVVEAVQGTKMQQFQGPPFTANTQLPLRKQEASIEENSSSLLTDIDPASFDEKSVASVTLISRESELGCTLCNNDRSEDILGTGARILNSVNSSLLVEEAIPVTKFQQIKIAEGVAVDSISDGEKQEKCQEEFKSNLQECLIEQGDSLDEIVEDTGDKCASSICPLLPRVEPLNSLVPPEGVLNITSERENQTLQSLIAVAGCCEVEILESCVEATENAKYCHEQGHPLDQADEDIGNKCSGSIYPTSFRVESADSFVPQEARVPHIYPTNKKENKSPQSLIAAVGWDEMEILESCVEATDKAKSCHEQGHSPDEIVEGMGYECTGSVCPISHLVETVNAPVPQEANLEITSDKENQTPQSLISVTGFSEMEMLESCVEATESAKYCHNEEHPMDEAVENIGNDCSGTIFPIPLLKESVNSSVAEETGLKITNKNEDQTPLSLIPVTGYSEIKTLESRVKATEKGSNFVNICLRRCKAASSPEVRTRKSRFMSTSNVDTEAEMSIEKDIIDKSMPKKDPSSVLDGEEKVFTQNKENSSPNMLHLRFMRKESKLEEDIKHPKSQRSHSSNKENQAPKVVQERKLRRKPLECHTNCAEKQDNTELMKNRVERVPFQSLMNSGSKHKSAASGPVSDAKSIDAASSCGRISNNHTKPSNIWGEEKRSWDMVVDTASLLNKKSRKALLLLQGLKGTRLIIPRLVIKELESMRRQFRIFRRISEASLALEWIEECMANTKWWIHIESSIEECRLIAPTPPASPQTEFIEEIAFPGPSGSKEIASRTVEDHILHCALLCRRKENNRQLVLLSDDVPLKIRSMAEGLLCKTVLEFRQSLVNPFSERFIWTNSSPRGLTWSCQDDTVLREKYCGLPSKAGLKLITEQYLYSQV